MAVKGYFFNAVLSGGVYDRIYNASDVTSYLDQIVGSGVFPIPSNQLQVRATTGMDIAVGAGSGWINGHKIINTSDLLLTVADADLIVPRIDRVIFYVDQTSRSMGIEIKTGTPSATPTAPALVRTASRYEMCLAEIMVAKQVAEITNAVITDTRGDSSVCGFVQGLIQQMDTSTMFQQWQALFEEWMQGIASQFNDFKQFKKLEGIAVTVDENETQFNVSAYVPQFAFAYDILEIYINGIHLTGNEYTMINNVVTLETPIEKAGSVVDFVVYHMVNPE